MVINENPRDLTLVFTEFEKANLMMTNSALKIFLYRLREMISPSSDLAFSRMSFWDPGTDY